jgi:uncharacterized protein (TIGR02452 family)
LNGAQAQEEAIARASGLHASIAGQREMYDRARADPNPLYTDHMIYSPDVPYFRDDDHQLLDRPFKVSVITSPAVNAKQCTQSVHQRAVYDTMKNRMRKVIRLAAAQGNKVLVLGAFGCGVFGNDPAAIARIEKELLVDEGLRNHFDVVANPIPAGGGRSANFETFRAVLGPVARP